MMFYWWQQKRKMKRDPVGFIRQEFAFWGHSLDHMTDDEVKQAVVEVGKMFGKTGINAKQAIEGLKKMAPAH